MRALLRPLSQLSINPNYSKLSQNLKPFISFRKPYSTEDDKKEPDWAAHFGAVESSKPDPLGWDAGSSAWSTGLTKEHFDGEAVGRQVVSDPGQNMPIPSHIKPSSGQAYADARWTEEMKKKKELADANRAAKKFIDSWDDRMDETTILMKQVREPGARGSYLKDSEKAEMYKKHKENPEVYTVEKLAKDYRIMRQRVLAILFLKEDEEEVEKKLGHPLDDSVEFLLDECPEFFISHDREFHVASLPYKPDFKVMPEGWDGTARDPDEVHYEISMREDEMLYQEYVRKFNFNKMKVAKKFYVDQYSRRRPDEGWDFTVEKLGQKDQRGNGGGGWKFKSLANGSTRPLNEFEKMFVKRETKCKRKKILP